jgi:hypothetical protein
MTTIKISQLPDSSGALTGAEQLPADQSGITKKVTAAQLGANNVVSVQAYGAVGDGVADDTAAIITAQNYAASIGGATVYFPPGEYKISSAIPMLPGITYCGPQRAELGAYNPGRSRIFSNNSDIFTNTATLITGTCLRDLFLESVSGGGHIFNWSNNGIVAKIEMSGVCMVQKNAAKSVIYGNMPGSGNVGIFSIWLHDFEYEFVPACSVPAIYLKAFTINSVSISNFWSTPNGESAVGQPSIWIESTNASGAAFNVFIKQGVLEYASSGGITLLSCANSIVEDCTSYDTSIAIGAPVFKVDKGASGPASNNIAFRACRSTIGNATHADLYLNTAESGQGSFWVENCTFSYLDSASTLPGTATAIVNSSITNFVDTAYLQFNFSPESNIRFGNSLGSSKYYDIWNGYFNNFEGYLNIMQNGSYVGSINPSGNFYWGGTRSTPKFYVLKADGKVFAASHIYPGTGGGADQDKAGLLAGEGAPSNGNGNNGDFYFRSDGGALTTIYQKRTGAWVGIV